MRKVIVWPRVHNTLWQILYPALYDKVLDSLYHQLQDHLDRWQPKRLENDPDTHFVYRVHVATKGEWHTFDFHVCDTISPDDLIVTDVSHTQGKA